MATVKVVVIADDSGHITIDTEGPIRGKDGLVVLLEEALKMAKRAR